MTIPITIFFISFLATLGIIGNKIKENETGTAFVSFHRGADDTMHRFGKKVRGFVKHAPREMARLVLYFLVHKAVLVYEKLKEKVYPRISHIVDAVKGRNVPKNKGNASFFLTMEKNQKDLKETEL